MLWVLMSAPPAFAEDRFFDSNGVRIRYVDEGAGVIKNLSRDHRVIAVDMRGHGKSEKPQNAAAYRRHMSQDIVRLLDHLRIAKAHLVGYFFGAVIAGYTAINFPDRFITATFGGLAPMIGPWSDLAITAIEEYRQLRPDAALVVIEGATHAAPRNARARPEFCDAIRNFIGGHPAR